jgi:hypothetical protein
MPRIRAFPDGRADIDSSVVTVVAGLLFYRDVTRFHNQAIVDMENGDCYLQIQGRSGQIFRVIALRFHLVIR